MWYDWFAHFYDRSLEDLYAPFRQAATDALALQPGHTVLDLPCGTGQSLPSLVHAVGPTGMVFGVDASRGMLSKASKRVQRMEWDNVVLHQGLAHTVTSDLLTEHIGSPHVDGVLCALGLTAFPDWERTLDGLMTVLRPGGRFVIFDVVAHQRTLQTRSVELVARADLSRHVWTGLDAHCDDVERTVLPADPKTFGGELYVAVGTRREV